MSIDFLLYCFAFLCFLIASYPNKTNLRFEWIAAAALVLSQII